MSRQVNGLLLLIVVLTGCDASDNSRPAVNDSSRSPRLSEWHDQYDMPWEYIPSEISFAQPAIRDRFLRADELARRLVGPSWQIRAADKYPYLNWNAGTGGYRRTYHAQWKKSGSEPVDGSTDESHIIALGVTVFNRPRRADAFRLSASRRDANEWTSSFTYYCSNNDPRFTLNFRHPEFLPAVRSLTRSGRPYNWAPGTTRYSAVRLDERFRYEFEISTWDKTGRIAQAQPTLANILSYFESPESFRAAAQAEVDRLELLIREYFATNTTGNLETHGGPTGGDPPQPGPPPEEVPHQSIRDEVFKEALQDIDKRNRVLTRHFKEMHAALIATFPGFEENLESKPDARPKSEN